MKGKRVGSPALLPAIAKNKRHTEVSPAVTEFDTSDGNHIEHRVEIGKRVFVLLHTSRSTTVLRPRVQVLVGPRGLPGARGASGPDAGLKSNQSRLLHGMQNRFPASPARNEWHNMVRAWCAHAAFVAERIAYPVLDPNCDRYGNQSQSPPPP